ncbi:MAG: hypothetical protein KF687_10540 [Cyclobacteriaceae bacterium]|nr:hypothetical protein [Cyclobacteriaceae bacterium]
MIAPIHAMQHQQAQRMNGAFIRIDIRDFQNILHKAEGLLVVESKTGIFASTHLYLTSYKGFIVYCKSKEQLSIPDKHEKIYAPAVSLPNI